MLLRTLMVVVVVSLGLDVPVGRPLERVAHDGQAWCAARLAQIDAWWTHGPARWVAQRRPAGPGEPEAGRTPAPMPNGRLAFADERPMPNGLTAFADDRAMPNGRLAFAPDDPRPPAEDGAFAAVVDQMVDQFRIAENRDGGVDRLQSAPRNGEADRLMASVTPSDITGSGDHGILADEPHPRRVPSSRVERVQVAFRLTGEALQAWLSLVQVPPTGQ
jgi:hypothetical protein